MVRVDGEIVINRLMEEVFDFVADEGNEPRYTLGCAGRRRSRRGRSAWAPGTGRSS
jgi:hypothetical protein